MLPVITAFELVCYLYDKSIYKSRPDDDSGTLPMGSVPLSHTYI